MIISLLNNKGGVGKTTTAVNLSASLVTKKRRVLLVDLDSQGSASLSLGIPRAELEPSCAQSFFEDIPIKKLIRKTNIEGLDIVTGSMALANADLMLSDVEGRERCLEEILKPTQEDYGFIILDCPPSLSLIPINALIATDAFIVPVTPHYLALEGLINLLEAVEKVRQGIGVKAKLLGFVLTMVDYRNKANVEIAEMIREQYKGQVFKSEIRVNVRLAEAPSFGKTIFEYDDKSTGAKAYKSLAREVVLRSKKGK